MKRWAVILAGGVGSRFWPLSTPSRPKQLLPLVDGHPLLSNTVERLTPLVPPERTLVVTGSSLAPAVRDLLPQLPADNVLAEPRAAGTAPALAWAALEVARRDGRDAVMMCVHADWAIGDPEGFRRVLRQAADVASRNEALVTVGVVPSRPDPGFGYIQPGAPCDGARRVERFVEKPDRQAAERMVPQGYLWNSGIFVWRAGDFLDEARAVSPELSGALADAADDIGKFFHAVTPIAVDYAVLERSRRVLVIAGDFAWDDVGTWAALRRVRRLDGSGNAVAGPVFAVASRDNVVHAEGNTVVLYGVSDLVVVSRDGLTLVTTTERAADLKTLLDALPADVRNRA